MGMPIITPGTGTRNQAVTDLIQSVALQETALSHIMNAEGEKMQAIIAMPNMTADKLLELNDSVHKMLNAVTRLEMMFQTKLEMFADEPDTETGTPLTAPIELAKIDVPYVTIDVAYTDPLALASAVAAAAAAGQTQVADGYNVIFTPSETTLTMVPLNAIPLSAIPLSVMPLSQAVAAIIPTTGSWILTGTFTVTKIGVPADTATNDAIITIVVISSAPSTTTAAEELAKINVTNVSINVPLTDSTAQTAAINAAIAAAQAQIAVGYSAAFTPTSYNSATGTLIGKYTVTNDSAPTDTATDAADRTILVTSAGPATTALSELGKITTSGVSISVPLNDTTAQTAAVNAAITAAQSQVAPGYTVTYTPTNYDPATGTLLGKYTVTNTADPTDTASDPTDRTITVTSDSVPATTAAAELAKLATVNTESIFVPLDDATAGTAAVTAAVNLAKTLVAAGYTVTFAMTSYTPGTLVGSYTVTNTTDSTDTATDTADRTITVTSTVISTTAPAELQKIDVPSVNITFALTDPLAQQAATDKALLTAQSQVVSDYTVTFTLVSYDGTVNPGQLIGTFTVTNNFDSTDTAADGAPRTINVISVPANATSNATASFLSGSLLGNSIDAVPGLTSVQATYTNGTDTTSSNVQTSAIDGSQLSGITVPLNALNLDLGSILQLGAANQYAEAYPDGISRAYAGAVSNNGVIDVSGASGFPANATLDLTQLLPGTDVISNAQLTIGAITSQIYNDVENPVTPIRDYSVAGATFSLASPAITQLVTTLNTILGNLNTTIGGLGATVLQGFLGNILDLMNTIGSLPALGIGTNDIAVSLSIDVTTALDQFLAQPISLPDGSLTLDLQQGTLFIDLSKFWGGTLNAFPPNTPLFSSTLLNSLEDGKTALLIALTTAVETFFNNIVDVITLTVSGHITLATVPVLGTEAVGLTVAYNGTVGDLVRTPTLLTITPTGTVGATLGTLLDPVTNGLPGALVTTITNLLFDPNNNIVNAAWELANAAVKVVTTTIAPVFQIVAQVISIDINVQTDNAGTFTEIPIQLNLLATNAAAVDLAKVTAGPNTYTVI